MINVQTDEDFIAQNRCLTNFEAARILDISTEDNDMEKKRARDYAYEFSRVSNEDSLQAVKETLRANIYLSDYEIATLVNLLPTNVEDVKQCCPSLNSRNNEEIDEIIHILTKNGSIN